MGALILKGGLRIPHNNIALTGFYNPCLQRNFLFMGVGILRTLTPLVPCPVDLANQSTATLWHAGVWPPLCSPVGIGL